MIWALEDARLADREQLRLWYAQADRARQEKVLALEGQPLAQRCSLCADHLARQLLARLSGQAPERILLHRSPMGKPFAPELPFHFSLSHSGPYVLCAAHSAPLGADVQQLRPVSAALARRVCSPEELAWCCPGPAPEPERFFRLWTRKEALVKLKGGSLLQDPRGLPALSHPGLRLLEQQGPDYLLSILYP